MKRIVILGAVILATACASRNPDDGKQGAAARRALVEEQALRTVETQWAEAVKAHDAATVDKIQAEGFQFTSPGGRVWSKAEALEPVKAGDLEISSYEISDVKVALYGETGVVTYRVVWNGSYRGMDISGPQRMTDVFVKRDGRWQCVASAATRLQQR